MVLSDQSLKQLLQSGRLYISPLDERQIQPASIDICLGTTYSVVEDNCDGIIELDKEITYRSIQAERYLLLPGQFVLATTREYFRLPDNLTAFVEGRSSIGRLGLFIQNAGWVDPGFEGEITLELFNANKCAIELNPAGVSANWSLRNWTGTRRIPTGASIRGKGALQAPVSF